MHEQESPVLDFWWGSGEVKEQAVRVCLMTQLVQQRVTALASKSVGDGNSAVPNPGSDGPAVTHVWRGHCGIYIQLASF